MTTTTPSIAICGAGPAGLTLASLLSSSPIKFNLTIFELDASPISRPDQGGTLDLHYETGLAAIQKCGLWETFLKYARYEGEEMIIADKNGTTLLHKGGGKQTTTYGNTMDRPEIDRQKLKEILLDSIPADIIKWGYHLRSVDDDGMLQFDGKAEKEGPFDLIVGADGAWSKIRSRLTSVKPVYSGITGYEMEIKEPSKTCPHIDKMVGRGSYMGISDRKFMGAQRMADDSLKVRSWQACPVNEAKDRLEKLGKKGTLEKVLEMYSEWAPELTEILKQGEVEGLHFYALHELPVGSKWDHVKGFTLIGDAASLMTPFSGEGVNKAMKDALELAELIEKSQQFDKNEKLTLDQAVKQYELVMFPRAAEHQADTMFNKNLFFQNEDPVGILAKFIKHTTSQSSWFAIRMLGSWPIIATASTYFWTRVQLGWAVRTFWRRT